MHELGEPAARLVDRGELAIQLPDPRLEQRDDTMRGWDAMLAHAHNFADIGQTEPCSAESHHQVQERDVFRSEGPVSVVSSPRARQNALGFAEADRTRSGAGQLAI